VVLFFNVLSTTSRVFICDVLQQLMDLLQKNLVVKYTSPRAKNKCFYWKVLSSCEDSAATSSLNDSL
jgi:hypothetical protein